MFLIGITLYLIVLLVIGVYASRRVHSAEDYLVANRRLPTWLAVPTIVATWFGAGTCLGVSGMVYAEGFGSIIADPIATSGGLIVAGLFFASAFRKLRLLTVADILGKTYGKNIEVLGALLMLPLFIGTLASQMLAMGTLFDVALGVPPIVGMLVGSLVVLVYTFAGGMWAVSITDMIQMASLILSLGVLLFVTIGSLGEISPVIDMAHAELQTLQPQSLSFNGISVYLGQILMTGLGAIIGQDLIQRFLSCKTARGARWSSVSSGFIYFLLGSIPIFIGLAGRILYPHLDNPETLIPVLAAEKLSTLTFGLFAAGLLSAIMSTADSYLLAATSVLTQNILPRTSLQIIRLSNIAVITIALVLALYSQSIFNLMVHSGATLFVSLFVPITVAVHWKKASHHPAAAWSAILLGLFSWIGWILYRSLTTDLPQDQILFSAATVGGAMSLVGFFVPVIAKKISPSYRTQNAT